MRMVRLYGSEAAAIVELDNTPLPSLHGVQGEITWAARQEAVTKLEDLVFRRTRWAMFQPTATLEHLPELAEQLGRHLHWSDNHTAQEVYNCRQLIKRDRQPLMAS